MKLFLILFFFLTLCRAQETTLQFEQGKDIQIKGNKKHLYKVSLYKGGLLQLHLLQKGVDLQIIAFSPTNDTLQKFDSPNGKNGLEIVELPIKKSGVYQFEISPFTSERLTDSIKNTIDGSYVISKYKVLSQEEHKQLIHKRKAQKDSVISWIKNTSITLQGVKAETGVTDLLSLKKTLKGVQVVGLGETSHGTKEIFQMKHRILEFLVKEMGFTIFAIEASHIGCKPINDYVLHGTGSSRKALSAQGFWVWNTEEVIDMIEWMYNYNKTVSDDKKVQFIGIDTQMVALDLAYKNIRNYVKNIGPHPILEIDVDSLFQKLTTNIDRNDISSERQKLYTLLSYLVVNKTKLISNSSPQTYRNTISDLRKIIQGVEVADRKLKKKADYNIRDEYMAQTILEVLQKKGPKAKMALWAHNGHITKNPRAFANGYQKPLGSVLKQYLRGKKYYAIGFATSKGSFQARNYSLKEKKYGKAASFKIYPTKEGNLDWYFEQSKKDIFFINFKQHPNHNAIQSFLNETHKTNDAGANWTFEYDYSPTRNIAPGISYDGMIFIKETSSAILTPGGHKEIEKRLKEGK